MLKKRGTMKRNVKAQVIVGTAVFLLFAAISVLWIFVLGPEGSIGKAYAFFYTGEPVKTSSEPFYETKPDLDATKTPNLRAYVCRDLHPRSNKDFYVDENSFCGSCSDSGPGTVAQPWCTFERAFKKGLTPHLEGSGKLYIREGTYRFDSIRSFGSVLSTYLDISGTENNPTIIGGYPGEKPTIYFSDMIQGWERYSERLEENIWVINWKDYLQANHNGQYLYTYKGGTRAPQLVAIDENQIILFQEINSLKNGWTFSTSAADSWADRRFPGESSSLGTDQFDMNQGTIPTFYYESDATDPDFGKLFIWLPDGTNPNNRNVEVSVSPAMPFAFADHPMNYINIKNLIFRFGGGHFGAVILSGSYNRFENLDSSYNGFTGLAGICKNCVVKNSIFRFNGDAGAGLYGDNTIYDGNIIEGNNVRKYNRFWHAGGIKFAQNPGATNNNMVFRNNLVKNNDGWGVWFDGTQMENAVIDGNVIVNNSLDGIRIEISGGTTKKPAKILNNILLNNGNGKFGEELDFYGGVVLSGSRYVLVDNNLVYDSPGGVLEVVVSPEYPLRQNTLRNNIFLNVSFPLTIQREAASAEGNTANNNVFMNSGPSFFWDHSIQYATTWEDRAAAAAFTALWEKLDQSVIFCYGWCFDWANNAQNFTQWQALGFDQNSVLKAPRAFDMTRYGISTEEAPRSTKDVIARIRQDVLR